MYETTVTFPTPSKPQDGWCCHPSVGYSRSHRPPCRRLFPGRRRRHLLLLSLWERGTIVLYGRRLSSLRLRSFFLIGEASEWSIGSSCLASARKLGRRSAARLSHPPSQLGPIVGGVRADRPTLRGCPRPSDLASSSSAPSLGEPSARRPSATQRCQTPPGSASPYRRPTLHTVTAPTVHLSSVRSDRPVPLPSEFFSALYLPAP